MKKRRKISFRMHITIVFAVAVALVVLVCWGACKLFLKDYYENNKLDQLEEVYAAINASMGEDGIVTEQYEALEEYCYRVTSDERITIFFSYYDEDGELNFFSTSFMDSDDEEMQTEDMLPTVDRLTGDTQFVPGNRDLSPEESDGTLTTDSVGNDGDTGTEAGSNGTSGTDTEAGSNETSGTDTEAGGKVNSGDDTEESGTGTSETGAEEDEVGVPGEKTDASDGTEGTKKSGDGAGSEEDGKQPPEARNRDGMESVQELFLFYSGFDSDMIQANIGDTLRVSDNYKISLLNYSASETTTYDLHGYTDCGLFIVLRANQSNITSASKAACDFLTYVGIIVIVLGSIMVFFLSRYITRPIEHMSKAADEMAHLHFDVHCPESRTREMDSLADSLNHLSEELETTIAELKESNNELQKDIAHKVEIDNMRSEFLSNVSHELKTPIALIQGYAEGLNENLDDGDIESRRFYCDVIIDEAHKMNTMVRKLLTLNQIECGQDMLSMERFDLTALVRSVIDSTEVLGRDKNVIVHFKETAPVYVWADEYMIEEVVTNYISNAFHHVAKSNEIAVTFEKKDGIVRCSVYNTGNPIPEEDIDKIWTKFYKVDKARTREYGGSGIGLSIVKAIMDNHNREFGVINHEGGVEFWFTLELAEGETITEQGMKK